MAQNAIWIRQRSGAGTENGQGGVRAVSQSTDVRRRRFAAEIDSRIDRLPAFPTVLSELIGLTNSADSAANDLRTCIEKDPVLTARLLRLANSAFYSPRVPVTSVQQAVVMLGHLSVKSLAMAAATLKFLGRGMDAYHMPAGGLWMHSYVSAELAREIASVVSWDEDTQDGIYVGALLHDIGKIVLSDTLEAALRQGDCQKLASGEKAEKWEEELTGFSHLDVGEKIAQKWRLAPVTTVCIRFHHHPEAAPTEFFREVSLVALADAGVRRVGAGLENPDEDLETEERACTALGIPWDRFDEVLASHYESVSGAQELFSNMGGAS